ncbi:dihydropteroate synthase [Flavobacterium sp. SM2513]|uniref:dihydropteroate synthase n=1 Tax=Flavobacterium sp. SM2513 TaxID=3424766 RepID=UPI003D7F9BAC
MTINCKGTLIDLTRPKVMGILNLTPNSFFDGGQFTDENTILNQVEKMLNEGATFIDVGAYSSKPDADYVSEEEELRRLIPIVKLLVSEFPEIILSIDTFRSPVAEKAIEAGASIINDISAGNLDTEMMKTIAKLQVPYIMMHMKGTPKTMQSLTQYEDVLKEMMLYFAEKINLARSLGINDLIVDPGYGFAKTTEQNFEVLHKSELFKHLNVPILAGLSRKSMIYKTLDCSSKQALNGTTVLNTLALTKGANILRVHDVKEAMETIALFEAFQETN